MAKYSSSSPYFYTSLDEDYLDILAYRGVPVDPTDVSFEILQEHQYRPDLLAYDLYGDPNLWWVFAVRNREIIKDPIFDMYAGQIIMVSQPETIKAAGL